MLGVRKESPNFENAKDAVRGQTIYDVAGRGNMYMVTGHVGRKAVDGGGDQPLTPRMELVGLSALTSLAPSVMFTADPYRS